MHDSASQLEEFASVLQNDPGPLDPWSMLYVPNLQGAQDHDVVERLAKRILRNTKGGIYLFSGQRGTGKSTELRRLKFTLEQTGKTKCYILDALEYIADNHPINLIDLFLIITLAFASEYRNYSENPTTLERINNWMQSEVFLSSATVANVKFEFKGQRDTILQRIRQFDSQRKEHFASECRTLLKELSEQAKSEQKVDRIVIAVDSLERLRGTGGKSLEMFERVVDLFEGAFDKLEVPGVDMIYSVPPYLQYLASLQSYANFFRLTSPPIFKHPDIEPGAANQSGIELVIRVVERRFPEWQNIIEKSALEHLIIISGGDLRQLLRRLLLDLVEDSMYLTRKWPITKDDKLISVICRRHSQEFTNLVADDELEILKAIHTQKKVQLKTRQDLTTIARFFDIRAILNYHDGTSWVDVNPLLWPIWAPAPHG